MLKSLTIQNYVLIDHLELDFSSGYSVITGETGAGKSILLGALGLILGDRADLSVVSDKAQKCVVEGCFEVNIEMLSKFFVQYDIVPESEIIIRRILLPGGKSRAFVNEMPVKLDVLKTLGSYLLDIHSQNQNQVLKDPQFQLGVVDAFADNQALLSSYQKDFETYKKLKKEYEILLAEGEQEKMNLDFYQHQMQKFEVLDLENINTEELDKELEIMQHGEQIQGNLSEINQWANGGDQSAMAQLQLVLGNLQTLQKYLPAAGELSERMESLVIEFEDLNMAFSKMAQGISVDPERLSFLQSQMSTLYQLFETFRVQTVSALCEKQADLAEKIQLILSFDEKIEALSQELESKESALRVMADRITESRKNVFPRIEESICKILQAMGMPHAELKIEQKICSNLNQYGQDQILFLFSANLGQGVQDIARAASGGEIARIMFALKSLLSSLNGLPTIIFDEIDTGISGNIAETMGVLMKKMGVSRQVITITHLPQIAAKGDHHLVVAKDQLLGKTTTTITLVEGEVRVAEIAKMLSGQTVGDAALGQAEALIKG